MNTMYDAVVIGAGLGGLVAGGGLGRSGLRTLVLERSPHPGGTAYAFVRRGYSFPMGPLGFSSPDLVRSLLLELDPALEPSLRLRRARYRVKAYGLDLPLSLPFAELAAEFSRAFPGEAPGVDAFFRELDRIIGDPGDPSAASIMAADFVSGLINDRRLQRVLGSIGAGEPYSSLALLAAMWDLVGNRGVWRVAGGLARLCDDLSRAVSRVGAEVRLSSGVSSIVIEGGRVGGVVLDDGSLVRCSLVVSNADYKTTFLSLIPSGHLPGDLVAAIASARQTSSNIQVSLGVRADRADLGAFHLADSILHRSDRALDHDPVGLDPDWSRPELGPGRIALPEMEISLVGGRGDDLEARGRAAVIIRTAADYNHFTRFRPSPGRRVAGYLEYKTRLARELVSEAERVVPGLGESVEVLDVATPLTFAERGGRSEGAVAGWSWDFGESNDASPRELIRTPIAGLFLAGYQAYSNLFLGGVPTAALSGKKAVEMALFFMTL